MTVQHERPPVHGYRVRPGLLVRVVGALMTTGDILWGNFRPGFFDPTPLARLAEYMRDGKWLNLQTENGPLERVRITEIRVYVQSEDIVLRQEWIDSREEFQHRQLVIESESIWKAWPIKMSVSDVKPPVETRAAEPDQVFGVILNVLIADTGYTTGQLTGPATKSEPRRVDARHSGCVLLYEMTDMDPVAVCEKFGYKSQQPLLSARWKMDAPSQRSEPFARDTRRRAREVWKRLGYPARRTPGTGWEPTL